MFFKKKKEKTPKTSNRKVVPNMKPIEELRTNKDVAEWCRDFLRITDELSPELAIADRAERNYLMALVGFLVEWCPRKDLSLESLAALLSLADARENDEDFKSGLDLLFVQIEEGKAYSYVAEYHQYLWVPSKYRRNSDGTKPADRKGLVGSEDFALLCWDSVNHLPAIRRISLKASLTSRLIDFKYLREADARPRYRPRHHGKRGVRKRPPSHLGKRLHGLCLRRPPFGTGKTGCHRPKMGNALEP